MVNKTPYILNSSTHVLDKNPNRKSSNLHATARTQITKELESVGIPPRPKLGTLGTKPEPEPDKLDLLESEKNYMSNLQLQPILKFSLGPETT